jgi:predicted nucleic acid-binding protein
MAHARCYIFDASVLSAFALVARLGLLEERYTGRATWTAEVYDELARGIGSYPNLASVLSARWLGAPIHSYDVVLVERIRLALGGKAGDPYRHLGEAATLAAAIKRGHIVAIDDYDATRYAHHHGIDTVNTIAILRALVRDAALTSAAAKDLLTEMIQTHLRRLPSLTEDELSA